MQLHDYQIQAVDHLHRNPRAALFLDMGLGKTAATLSALRPEDLPALVVGPKRVAELVWPTEVRKWRPDLTISLAAGTPKQRADALRSGASVVAIGRDNLADAEPVAGQFRTLVLDEMSSFKTKGTNRWKSANRIIKAMEKAHGAEAVRVWGLTGTPSPNGLLDLWPQIYLLDRGERLMSTLTGYRGRYFMPGRQLSTGVVVEWLLREGADAVIHRKLEDICLSMQTDGRIVLPPVTYNPVEVPLPAGARRVYRDMKADLLANLELLGGEVHTAANAAVLSNKLSQIAAGFLYHDEGGGYQVLHREKIKAVQEIVEAAGGNPIVVFYRYQVEAEMLKEALGSVVHTLDEPGVQDAWDAGRVPVLLAHPASAGHGLNLQYGGHTAVWTSLTWSLEEWMQANKRLARQGQQNPVVIHVLESPRTVDGAIRARLEQKKTVQQALLDHLESPL